MATTPNPVMQEDEIGVILRATLTDPNNLDAPIDLTGATISFCITSPAGVETTRSGSAFGAATNGTATYTTVSGDFDTVGTWRFQVKSVAGGVTLFSEVQGITVKSNLV